MSSTRRDFLAAGASAALPAGKRPNILFLMPDQHRYHASACFGNPDVKTPHIDRLASQGARLQNTFANTPVCCPARAAMLTGQYCHRNGMVANDLRLRESSQSFVQVLKDSGYFTGFIGKWHLDGGPRQPGYVPPGPRRHGYEFWAAHECSHEHFHNHYFRDSPTPIPIPKFEAEGWADVALQFLDKAKQDPRPFYLTVQWGPPHDPYKAPPKYRGLYDAEKLTLRPNYKAVPGVPTRDAIAEYYGMVTAIDDAVGTILKRLDDLGLAENTIVLYSSDHGDMLGSQGLRLKRKPWEESIRVPGILRWPGRVKPGSSSDQFFTHVDFGPTFLGMAGLKPPKAMQGRDLHEALAGGKSQGPDSAFLQIFGPYAGDGTPFAWRGVRTATHLYARTEDRPWLLYDLEKDPYQQTNLAGDGKLVAALDRRLHRWMRETGDSWRFNWSFPVEDAGRLYRDRAYYSIEEYMDAAGPNR